MNDPKKNADVDQARRAVFLEVDERENDELLQDQVSGYDFNKGIDYDEIFKTFRTTGFQAANLSKAIDIINEMLKQRQEPFESDNLETDMFIQRRSGCTIFLGYTSNIVSSGMRDMIRFLVQHKMVDCLVTTGGGIEEDLIKCLAPFYTGEFNLEGDKLREKALNRIGNLLVPNENYCKFEDWVIPILDEMLKEQLEQKIIWKPSTIIERLGKKINNEQSICYWAALNKIPIFCPALTDGSLGDMVFFHRKTRDPGLIIDIAGDIERINSIPLKARKSASVIIGAGIPKHHIFNANLMRGGSDYAVLLNTANEFDGSDAGARPDEAVSWGKIRPDAKSVKVHCDASIALPIIVAQTFAQHFHSTKSGLTKNP